MKTTRAHHRKQATRLVLEVMIVETQDRGRKKIKGKLEAEGE